MYKSKAEKDKRKKMLETEREREKRKVKEATSELLDSNYKQTNIIYPTLELLLFGPLPIFSLF